MQVTTERLNEMILNTVGQPLQQAAIAVDFGSRYRTLLNLYPKIAALVGKEEHSVPLERQIAIIDEVSKAAGMPMKYQRSEGGRWWRLDKKYPRKDIVATIHARQWVKFNYFVEPHPDYIMAGGRFGMIFNAVRVSEGEVLSFDNDWLHPANPWCFTEEALYQVAQESFALMAELQPHIIEGCTEGFRRITAKRSES